MKTSRKNIASIATAALAMVLGTAASHAVNRTLILLQENSNGKSYMTDILPEGPVRTAADAIIDSTVENGEAAKFAALAAGKYQRFVNLSDANCTRANLLNQLIAQSKDGYTVDLAILGHGGREVLCLHDTERLTGRTFNGLFILQGSIRALLTDARAREGANFNFKLRLVHMCNCFGGTTNDDWLAIGAKVSVGAPLMDWMPEPMNTLFWNDFVNNDKRVSQAAADSLAATRVVWQVVPTYTTVQENGMTKIQETQQLVSGDGNIIFRDECQLALNQSRTFTVRANEAYKFPGIYLVAGQRYSFTATGSWTNGFAPFSTTTNANGYARGFLDAPRFPSANMMRLCGERFAHENVASYIGNSQFGIGTSSTITAGGHGFLNVYANDILSGYYDNSGQVSVTVTRVP